MADSDITSLPANTAIAAEDLIPIANDPSGASSTESIKAAYLTALGAVDGMLIGGKLSVTVASNNITVAIVTNSGATPSSNSPVAVKINNTIRNITGSLSVTVNAGTNSFNAGAAEFAAKSVQYFAYLSWRAASSAVVIGFSRVPFANVYSDFSATATNEKYGAFSTAPASTDDCVVVGRFTATLSAGAGYTWTVPTFTSSNLIQRPIYETDWLTWSPTFTNLSVGNGTLTAYYKIIYDTLIYKWTLVWGSTTSISGSVTHTIPFTRALLTDIRQVGFARLNDATGSTHQGNVSFTNSTTAALQSLNASGTYLATNAISSTVPFTWTTSDEMMIDILPYPIR